VRWAHRSGVSALSTDSSPSVDVAPSMEVHQSHDGFHAVSAAAFLARRHRQPGSPGRTRVAEEATRRRSGG